MSGQRCNPSTRLRVTGYTRRSFDLVDKLKRNLATNKKAITKMTLR